MVTHRPAVLDLVDRVVVVEGGKLLMDGPKDKVLAALERAQAGATRQQPGRQRPSTNVHRHPGTQPVQQAASL